MTSAVKRRSPMLSYLLHNMPWFFRACAKDKRAKYLFRYFVLLDLLLFIKHFWPIIYSHTNS